MRRSAARPRRAWVPIAVAAAFLGLTGVLVVTGVLASAAPVSSLTSGPLQDDGPIALWNVTVVDVAEARLLPEMTVVIAEGEIAAVRPTATIRLGADVRRIEASHLYVMPGLIDAHAHLSYWGEDALGRLVAHGVTYIREMGGDPDQIEGWRAAVASGSLIGPSMSWCGPFLEGPDGGDEYRWKVTSAASATERGTALLERGVDFLKIQPRIGRDEVAALVAVARARGSSVVGHVPEGLSAIEAAELGLRSIEHIGAFLSLSNEELMATIEVLLRKGTWISPAIYSMVAQFEARGEDPSSSATIQRAYKVIRQLHTAGIPLLVGANFAYRDWPHAPGSSMHGEIRSLVEAGLPLGDVVRMSTLGNAEFLGLQATVGQVRAGARADLVVLGADPLARVDAVGQVAGVVLAGRYLDAAALEALVPSGR